MRKISAINVSFKFTKTVIYIVTYYVANQLSCKTITILNNAETDYQLLR